MYRALLFDLDGTLAETDSLHLPTWVDALRPYGVEVDEEIYRTSISGRSTPEIVRELLPHLSDGEAASIGDAKESAFRERAEGLEPLPGLLNFVAEAKKRGKKIVLVTNAPKENTAAILLALELREAFDEVVLADETEAVKPDPAPYNEALRRLGIRPAEALAFEDSASGITSATGAGVPTVGIASTQAPEKLREDGAFVVAEDFTDPALRGLLER